MQTRKRNFQKGTALISVMMVAVIVAGLSTTYVMRSIQTSRATRCNLNGEKALHIAEAGLDLAINDLKFGGSGVVSGQLGGGTYTVQVSSSWTGLYTVLSTAAYDGVNRSIETTVMFSGDEPLSPPAAITILNDTAMGLDTTFRGNAFGIVGYDTNINGTAGSAGSVYGIGVFDDGSRADILGALHDNGVQDDNVRGTGGDRSVADVSAVSVLTLQTVQDFADRMLLIRTTLFTGDTKKSGASFGSAASPQITYVQGSLELTGNSAGAGILVVDGTLEIRGNFDFNGLVILSARKTGTFDLACRGNLKLHGAIIICNPENKFDEFDFRGNVDAWYSSQALDVARKANGDGATPTIISWRRTR